MNMLERLRHEPLGKVPERVSDSGYARALVLQ